MESILHTTFAENRLRPDREFFALNSEELLQIPDIAHKNGYATILNNESELSKVRIIRKLLQKDDFDTEEECLVWYNELLDYLDGTEEHNNNVAFNLAMEAKGEYFSNDEEDTSPWVGEDAIDRIISCIGGDEDDVELVFELNPELREKIEFPYGAYDYESEYKLDSYMDYLESCTKNQVENPKRYIENKGHYYRIQKNLPSGHYVWGSYIDFKTALEVRDYLESCDWPLRLLQKADEIGCKRGEYLIMCMRRGVRV